MNMEAVLQRGARPRAFDYKQMAVYAVLLAGILFFAAPLYIMIATSFKPMDEIRMGGIFSLPHAWTLDAWRQAWFKACTGLECNGVRVGFWNSVKITLPSTALSLLLGAINGYVLHYWNARGGRALFGMMMVGTLLPAQMFIYPLVVILSKFSIYNSLASIVIVHVIFSVPITALLFRNYFAGLPIEVFKAARVDGAGFWQILFYIILPMSKPIIIVAMILKVTGVWNDYLFGLIFAGRDNLPMTTQLNAVVSTSFGERAYNVDMAATLLTAAVPLLVYFISGKWFVRGIAAGAVKG
jgi:glucose/mannose transport system permease protein